MQSSKEYSSKKFEKTLNQILKIGRCQDSEKFENEVNELISLFSEETTELGLTPDQIKLIAILYDFTRKYESKGGLENYCWPNLIRLSK